MEEEIPQEGDTRIRLKHKIMPKGELRLKLNDGTEMAVFAQSHELLEICEEYEDGEWIEYDPVTEDEFYLTGYEEGYLFYGQDILELFGVDDFEWENNSGFAEGWCEKEEAEDYETKWYQYQNRFPKATSKEQFTELK